MRVLAKKGHLKEALAASLKKVRLIEELESELIQQVEIVMRKMVMRKMVMFTIYLSFPGHSLISASWQLSTGRWRREEGSVNKGKTSCLGKRLRTSLPWKTTLRRKQLHWPPPLGIAQFIGMKGCLCPDQ